MGGKDDSRGDLDKWLDAQRHEVDKVRQQFHDSFDKELRSWADDTSPSPSSKGPFERFKSFIDSNLTTFSQGFRNFPSNISELKARMQQEREARRLEELDVWQRWTGSDDSPDHMKMQVERQTPEERKAVKEATYMLLRESYERNKHVPPSEILQLFRDDTSEFGPLDQFATPMLSMGGACYYKTETVENLPSTARWSWWTRQPQWLSVEWFKRGAYSPIRLETETALEESGINWRAAFEDLLCATLDKPMGSEEKVGQKIPYGKPQSTYRGPGLDWMLSLQCRGILPPQLPSLYRPVALFDGFDEVRRPRTVEFMHDLDQITANNPSARMYPLVKRDLRVLMDEVAIQSGPQTEAEPLHITLPATEKDLYDAMLPTYADLPSSYPARWRDAVPMMTGNDRRDFEIIADEMLDALDEKDYERAAKCIDAYYKVHKNLERFEDHFDDMLDESSASFWPEVMLALARSDLPNHEEYKRKSVEFVRRHKAETAEKGSSEKETLSSSSATPVKTHAAKKPDILSQLTTTHTTRLPDGTVTTKIVLKQRFTDGSEETHESVQTSRAEGSQLEPVKQEPVVQEPARKKGWFWN